MMLVALEGGGGTSEVFQMRPNIRWTFGLPRTIHTKSHCPAPWDAMMPLYVSGKPIVVVAVGRLCRIDGVGPGTT